MDLVGPVQAYNQSQSHEAQMSTWSWTRAIQGTAEGNGKLWTANVMHSPKLYANQTSWHTHECSRATKWVHIQGYSLASQESRQNTTTLGGSIKAAAGLEVSK
jgi:hypothetical protein